MVVKGTADLAWRSIWDATKGYMKRQAVKSSTNHPYTLYAWRAWTRVAVRWKAKKRYEVQPMYEELKVATSPIMHPIQMTKAANMTAVLITAMKGEKSFMCIECAVTNGANSDTMNEVKRVLTSGSTPPTLRGWNPSVKSQSPVMKRVEAWISGSIVSYLHARSSDAHMKHSTSVNGSPMHTDTARSARSACDPPPSAAALPPQKSATAHMPSVRHQYMRWKGGGSRRPPALIVSSTYDPESDDVTK
mmetsp:Transcript_15139/g.29882  ORF Transcript_15139/g.29882 Transcript_15139/m.29882 type:complete len:247 (+) Transcript_15139:1153-1893(+)